MCGRGAGEEAVKHSWRSASFGLGGWGKEVTGTTETERISKEENGMI